MVTYEIITVTERGSLEIDRAIWRVLSSDLGFWQLVDNKRLKVRQVGQNRTRLEGTSYVGEAVFGNIRLQVSEKIEGATAALLNFVTHDAFRIDKTTAPATNLGELAALLIKQFLILTKQYVSDGREFVYVKQRDVSSLIGGRIRLADTLSLRARGLRHLVAFDRNVVTRSTIKNRLISAALLEIEHLTSVVNLNVEILMTARGLASLFSDCVDAEVLSGNRGTLAYSASELAKHPDEKHKELLMLTAAILSHVSFEHDMPMLGTVPRAWFLNLESLFQNAVKRVLEEISKPLLAVHKGSDFKFPIFDIDAESIANPDLLLSAETKLAVGDVKYKEWTGDAARGDLYQLLVHASAFKANKSFLIYPSDRFESIDLGTAVTGSQTWLFAIDVKDLASSLEKVLFTMNML